MRLFNARAVGSKDPDLTVEPSATSRALTGSPARPELTPRIVHVAETIAGGIASFFEEIAPYQNQLFGAENVTFVIPAGSEVHLPGIAPSQIVTFAAGARGPRGLLAFGRQATAVVRRLDPDIVHLHSSFAGAVLRFALGRGMDRPRVIYCPHGWAFAIETSTGRKRIYAAIERWLTRRTDLVIANSETERQLAISFGLPADKIRVVRNGIHWLPPADRAPRSGRIRLAFIGRLDRQKGLDVLLQAISRQPCAHELHIVGESVLPGRENYRAGADDLVHFHGWLDRAAVMDLLSRVDAVVMPSRWEAFGLVAIEAMRAGIPVIASNRGALPEIVGDGVGGYVFDMDDPEALGARLNSLDRDDLARLGRLARARFEAEFSSRRMNEQTEQAYRSVLSSSAHGLSPALADRQPRPAATMGA